MAFYLRLDIALRWHQSAVSENCIVNIYPLFTRKRMVSLCFGRDVRLCSGVAIFEVCESPVFHIMAGASR